MDAGYAGVFDLQVEYWDDEVDEVTRDRVAQGWMMSLATDDLAAAYARVLNLEGQGKRTRIILQRPGGERRYSTARHRRPTVNTKSKTPQTMYEKYGQAGISAVCEGGYRRFLADPVLAPVFERYDLDRIKRKVRATFALVLGATGVAAGEAELELGVRPGRPLSDSLVDLIEAKHVNLGLSMDHVQRVADGFADAAREAGVTPEDVAAIHRVLMSYAPLLVHRDILSINEPQ